MADGYPGRFALETLFLILLAVGAGLADLRRIVIIGVMVGGWALVGLIELLVWRAMRLPQPVAASEPAPATSGWDLAEILAPVAEEPESEPAEPTTILPAEAPADEQPSRRRWLRRRAASE
jgi:hypothetical protein